MVASTAEKRAAQKVVKWAGMRDGPMADRMVAMRVARMVEPKVEMLAGW